jgi:hypothetical protein
MTTLTARPLAQLPAETQRQLSPLGLVPVPVPAMFAQAESGNGRMRLTSERWLIGPSERPIADARCVHIHGSATDIVNTMIFPVFAAELLSFGHAPRLAFVDLQTPGLRPERRAMIAEPCQALARRFAPWQQAEKPPEWATAHCSGGFFFSRMSEMAQFAIWTEVYRAYLAAWIACLDAQSEDAAAVLDPLTIYCQEHVAHTPGRPFLAKLFGKTWSERFLSEFVYGPVGGDG